MGDREHRCVGATEHDPAVSLFHGCCAACLEPWPCDVDQKRSRPMVAVQNQFTGTPVTHELAAQRATYIAGYQLGGFGFIAAVFGGLVAGVVWPWWEWSFDFARGIVT